MIGAARLLIEKMKTDEAFNAKIMIEIYNVAFAMRRIKSEGFHCTLDDILFVCAERIAAAEEGEDLFLEQRLLRAWGEYAKRGY